MLMTAHTYSLRSALLLVALAFGLLSAGSAQATPEWLRNGIVYEIYPRDFSATGDFAGVTAQLDRLQHLGVNILWLMPIHPIGTVKRKGTLGSPYAVRDFYAINADYGTAADFHRLVSEAHRRGLKVIIDIVANHTAWDSVLMTNSSFYTRDAGGNIKPPQPDWADVADLNYDDARLRRYMLDMLKYWIREFDLDGFRCDFASGVPKEFWEQVRAELSAVKPDIMLLAESEDPALLSRAFDIDYSWSLYHALVDVIQGQRPASALRDTWLTDASRYQRGALRLRLTDNHDENRAIARFGERGALAASALMFTLDGVPMLYNGMEVGDATESGAPLLFEKVPVAWSTTSRRPQFPLFYDALIALRRSHPALTSGSVEWIPNSDERRIVTFTRSSGDETMLIAINLTSQPFDGAVRTDSRGFSEIEDAALSPKAQASAPYRAANETLPKLSLGAWEFRVFRKQQMH